MLTSAPIPLTAKCSAFWREYPGDHDGYTIQVDSFGPRVEGFEKGRSWPVISIEGQKIGISTCLPVDLEEAKKMVNLYRSCIEEYEKVSKPKTPEPKVFNYTVPEWALSYLINGDASSLIDEDVESIDSMVAKAFKNHGSGHWSVREDENFYCNGNDVHGLGDLCVSVDYVVIGE